MNPDYYIDEENLYEKILEYQEDLKHGKLEMSFRELSTMYIEDELIINSEFMKLYNWDNRQKTDFIESVLLGMPLPTIFVIEAGQGRWQLIDGLQRLCTVLSFMGKLGEENKWSLGECKIIKEISGLSFDELPYRVVNILRSQSCRVEITYSEKDYVKSELLKRLHTNQTSLTDEEIKKINDDLELLN